MGSTDCIRWVKKTKRTQSWVGREVRVDLRGAGRGMDMIESHLSNSQITEGGGKRDGAERQKQRQRETKEKKA